MQAKQSRIQLMLTVDLIVLLVGQASGQFRQVEEPLQFLRPVENQHRFRARPRSVDSFLAKTDVEKPVLELASSAKSIQEHQQLANGGTWQAAASQWLGRGAANLAPAPGRVQSKCQKRSLGRVIKSAKSLLTDGLEQYATQALLVGSLLASAATPLATLVLPLLPSGRLRMRQQPGAEANETGVGTWARRLVSSLAEGGVQGRVDSVMGWIERSVEHLPNFPRLHPQECVKRVICEAYHEPDKHGATGLVLRILFPATNLTLAGDELEYKVTNKYRHAAGYGLARRLEAQNGSSSSVCREKYEDCVVSLLEVAQNLIDVFLR